MEKFVITQERPVWWPIPIEGIIRNWNSVSIDQENRVYTIKNNVRGK